MTNTIEFFVEGFPKPAGSKNAFFRNNKIVVFDASNNKHWKRTVAWVARKTMLENNIKDLFACPIYMELTFYIKPPKNKPDLINKFHCSKPDLTKLIRCVEDAMIGVVYIDDRFIVKQTCKKLYSNKAGVKVRISKVKNLNPYNLKEI